MLTTVRLLTSCLLMVAGLVACDSPTPEPPASPAQLRLHSVQNIAQSSAANYTYTYSYDSQNRVITIDRLRNGVVGQSAFTYGDPQRKYIGPGDNPDYTFYIERPNSADQSTWTISRFPLVLDGTDFVVNQYRTYPGPIINMSSTVRDYYYKFDATKHIKSMQTAGPSNPGDFNYYTYTTTGDNITSQELTAAGGHGGVAKTTYTYDTSQNPFLGMPDPTTSVLQRFSRNNVTSSVSSYYGSTVNETYAYEYNAQGLPTKRTATSNGAVTETLTYTYENY